MNNNNSENSISMQPSRLFGRTKSFEITGSADSKLTGKSELTESLSRYSFLVYEKKKNKKVLCTDTVLVNSSSFLWLFSIHVGPVSENPFSVRPISLTLGLIKLRIRNGFHWNAIQRSYFPRAMTYYFKAVPNPFFYNILW